MALRGNGVERETVLSVLRARKNVKFAGYDIFGHFSRRAIQQG